MIDLEPHRGPEELAARFDFTPEDLEVNRKGIITKRQRENLITRYIGAYYFFLAVIIVFGLIILVLTVHIGSLGAWLFLAAAALLESFLALHLHRRRHRILEVIALEKVRCVTGATRISNVRRINREVYCDISIRNKSFKVPLHYTPVFDPNKQYRVYFARNLSAILSVEELA